MADQTLTIVVRGGEGSGRSQLAKQLEQFLIEKGYCEVHHQAPTDLVLYQGSTTIRDVPILIMEAP